MAPNAGSSISDSGSADRRIRSGRSSSSVSTVTPSLLTDQGNEADSAQVLLPRRAVGALRHLDEFLHKARIANGHHQPPAGGELIHERLRDVASARSSKDRVERRLVRAAARAVTLEYPDVVVAEPRHPLPRDLDELAVPLDSDDALGDAADDRRGISGARADLQHLVAGPDRGRLDHQSDDVRLGDGLPRLNRQRTVVVSPLPVLVVDELLTRHLPEGFENDRMGHTAGLDLPPDHAFAELCEIVHRALLFRNRLRAGAFRWLKTTSCSSAQSPRTTTVTWFRCCSVPMRSRSLRELPPFARNGSWKRRQGPAS